MAIHVFGKAIAKASFCTFLLLFLFSNHCRAKLIAAHDPEVVGNGTQPQDGFNLTRDTETGLEWLDLTLSSDMGESFCAEGFFEGCVYSLPNIEGFRSATAEEISTLFYNSAGLKGFETPPNERQVELMSMLGISQSGSTQVGIKSFEKTIGYFHEPGIFEHDFVRPPKVGFWGGRAVLHHQEDGFTSAIIQPAKEYLPVDIDELAAASHWLVRSTSVPEPASFMLMMAAALTSVTMRNSSQ